MNTKLSHPYVPLHAMIMSSHRVQHTPSTAYTENCIHRVLHHPKVNCLPLPASLSPLGRPCCTKFSTIPQLLVTQWIQFRLPSRLPPELPRSDWPPPNTPPISLEHGLEVQLHTRSIMASTCFSNLARPQPPRSHSHGLQVHISKLARLQPPSASPNSLDYSLQAHIVMASNCISPCSLHYRLLVCTITASMCITDLPRWQLPSLYPNSHDHGLQVRTIMASKCIFRLAQSRPLSASRCSLDYSVVKRRNRMADSPSSTQRRTSHGIRREFFRKTGCGPRNVGTGWEDMKGYAAMMNHIS